MIKIKVLDIDDGDDLIHYNIYMDNGICSTGLEFYGYDDLFKDFAEKLTEFPKKINDKVKFEVGKKGENYSSYLMLQVYCYKNNGQSSLKIDVWNNGDGPTKYESKFEMASEPASINRLGIELKNWNPIKKGCFEWNPYS